MAQSAKFLKALRRKYHLGEFRKAKRRRSSASTTRRTTKDLLAECRGQVKRVRAGLKLPTVSMTNPFMVK